MTSLLKNRRFKYALLAILITIMVWGSGLVYFSFKIPQQNETAIPQKDAIIVLTGAAGRIEKGAALLQTKKAKHLFISGVYDNVKSQNINELKQLTPDELSCCVHIGYQAKTTYENAIEIAEWAKKANINSIHLVTSSYHMPRSLFEIKQKIPYAEILPAPVFSENFKQIKWWIWPGSTKLLISEYHKFILAHFRYIIFSFFLSFKKDYSIENTPSLIEALHNS